MASRTEIRLKVLSELLQHEQLTRSDFIAESGFRPASVLVAVNQLKQDGLVVEPDRPGLKTGRRSPELRLNPQMGSFIGMELQTNRLLGCIIDGAGNILAKGQEQHPDGITVATARDAIEALFNQLSKAADKKHPPYLGVGFADPGLVDMLNQISLNAVNVPGWKNLDPGIWLREITDVSNVFIVPETMARTFAEYQARQPHPSTSLFHISLNVGIGGGFIKHGKLFIGDTDRSMEIGHLVAIPNGPQCQCGNRGCLEAIAGENGIRNKVAELIANGVRTELPHTDFSLPQFVQAVKNNDRAALQLTGEICDSIASSLATVITLLNPSTIVISGELAGLGNVLLDTINRTLAVRCFPGSTDRLRVECSTLDDFATCLSAARMARNRIILDQPTFQEF